MSGDESCIADPAPAGARSKLAPEAFETFQIGVGIGRPRAISPTPAGGGSDRCMGECPSGHGDRAHAVELVAQRLPSSQARNSASVIGLRGRGSSPPVFYKVTMGGTEVRDRLFRLRLAAGGSRRRVSVRGGAAPEGQHGAGSAAAPAHPPPAGAGQHVAAAVFVPAHQVGLKGVLAQQHRHRIVDMCGRDVPVRIHSLQGFDQSLLDGVGRHGSKMSPRARLCKVFARASENDLRFSETVVAYILFRNKG